MSRTVFCCRLKKDLPGLTEPPFPGARGVDIFDNVSEQAWLEWQHMQTMLINEKHLNLMDKASRKYLNEQRDKFLEGGETDRIEGYSAPEPGSDA
jgi:Fe-S cluster biosynthesis and repair protein YggX